VAQTQSFGPDDVPEKLILRGKAGYIAQSGWHHCVQFVQADEGFYWALYGCQLHGRLSAEAVCVALKMVPMYEDEEWFISSSMDEVDPQELKYPPNHTKAVRRLEAGDEVRSLSLFDDQGAYVRRGADGWEVDYWRPEDGQRRVEFVLPFTLSPEEAIIIAGLCYDAWAEPGDTI